MNNKNKGIGYNWHKSVGLAAELGLSEHNCIDSETARDHIDTYFEQNDNVVSSQEE